MTSSSVSIRFSNLRTITLFELKSKAKKTIRILPKHLENGIVFFLSKNDKTKDIGAFRLKQLDADEIKSEKYLLLECYRNEKEFLHVRIKKADETLIASKRLRLYEPSKAAKKQKTNSQQESEAVEKPAIVPQQKTKVVEKPAAITKPETPKKSKKKTSPNPEEPIPASQPITTQPTTSPITDEPSEFITKVKFPISIKLVSIISLIFILALGSITALVSYFISYDVRVSAEINNLDLNNSIAEDVDNRLSTIFETVKLLYNAENDSLESYVVNNQDIAAIYVLGKESYQDNTFFLSHELSDDMTKTMFEAENQAIENTKQGAINVINVSPYYNSSLIALLYPLENSFGETDTLIILYSTDTISNSFGLKQESLTFMTDANGIVLAHPDNSLVLQAADLSSNPLIQDMKESDSERKKLLFTTTDTNEEYFGAYRKLKNNTSIITLIPSETVFASVVSTTRRNIYLSITVLALAIIIIWFFSKTISRPIRRLTSAAKEVEKGNYEITLRPRTRDELGVLTTSFIDMGKGLIERERLKDSFGRFTNKEVAERAARGEIAIGGERKNCTIFFSDIRGFTGISDKLSPEEVVKFLNAYMGLMVDCIVQEGGTVDKFEGDAIMAIWGAPLSGKPKDLALHCVRAALRMRQCLQDFNTTRDGSNSQPKIRIGCGINSGPVIAGQIGSSKKMEYTVIGDAVNFASRTESLNKPLGTDILITENTWNLIKECVVTEEMPSVTVKGKEGPCRMFAVINLTAAGNTLSDGTILPNVANTISNGPKTLAEVRNTLGIPTPDLSKVNLNEEEKKYKIQSK